MFAPSIGKGPLAQTRRDAALDRGADAIHDLLEWQPPTRTPEKGFHITRDRVEPGALNRRVLFTGKFWMSDKPVALWRAPSKSENEVSSFRGVAAIASALVDAQGSPVAAGSVSGSHELSLVPMDNVDRDAELSSVKMLAGLEMRVEVVRFLKPTPGANGISTGRVLAVSENYSAQQRGANEVVVHENANLSRKLAPGEAVTLEYKAGKANVYDGLLHDINISAPWLPYDQQAYLRMVMFDALSQSHRPQDDDERLKDALRFALEATATHFGASDSKLRRANIELVVNDRLTRLPPEPAAEIEAPTARRLRHP